MSPVQGLEGRAYSVEEKETFARDRQSHLEYRKEIEGALNGTFAIFLQNTQAQNVAREYNLKQMREKLHNPYLEEKLIPE